MDIMNVEEYKTWIGGIARRFKQSQIKAADLLCNFYLVLSWGRAPCRRSTNVVFLVNILSYLLSFEKMRILCGRF